MRTILLLLALATPAHAIIWELPEPVTGRCYALTNRDARAVLRHAGVGVGVARWTVVLCDRSDGGVSGAALAPSGTKACPVAGTYDARGCLTLSACGKTGAPWC